MVTFSQLRVIRYFCITRYVCTPCPLKGPYLLSRFCFSLTVSPRGTNDHVSLCKSLSEHTAVCTWCVVEKTTLSSPGEDQGKTQISENEAWDLESFTGGVCVAGTPRTGPRDSSLHHAATWYQGAALPGPTPGHDILPGPTALRGCLGILWFQKV